jgi:gluconolactonase
VSLERCEVFVEGLDHPEGVCVDAEGTLYAGGEAGQVYRIDADKRTATEVANTGGFLLGLCADRAGLLYACDVGRRQVLRVDPRDGTVDVYSEGVPARPVVNPNWGVFDDAGVLYVTDSGHWKKNDGWIWRISRDGATTVWTEESRGFPNGACLTADGRALLVLESTTPALVRIPIEPDGTAGARAVVAPLPGTVPDGVTIDADGNAYVCYYRPDRIDKVTPDGAVTTIAEDPEGTMLSAPTNAVWWNGDLITGNLGRWHLTRVRLGLEGVPLRYP